MRSVPCLHPLGSASAAHVLSLSAGHVEKQTQVGRSRAGTPGVGREGPLTESQTPTHAPPPPRRDGPCVPPPKKERWGCELMPASGPTLVTCLQLLLVA